MQSEAINRIVLQALDVKITKIGSSLLHTVAKISAIPSGLA
jgi:hypothetical protein